MNPFDLSSKYLSSLKKRKDLSYDEAFLDVQKESTEPMPGERSHLNYPTLVLILLLTFSAIIGRMYWLQVVRGDEYRNLAEGNKLRTQLIPAPRGVILDRNNEIIAGNAPSFELVAIPSELPKDEKVLNRSLETLSSILNRPEEELREALNGIDAHDPHPQALIQNLSKDLALVLISRESEIPGFGIQNAPIRDYKHAEIFTHLVGYTGKITKEELATFAGKGYVINDSIGKTGLERQYEEVLRGLAGRKQAEYDATGNFKRTLNEILPQNGRDVKLNIDAGLQTVAFEALNEMLKSRRVSRAAVIISEPKTGKILTLISTPSFDSNMFARGISSEEYSKLLNNPDNPFLNRTVSGTYPPGSTVKPMLAVAALSEGIVRPETKILDDGVIRIGSYNYYGYDRAGLGLVDVYSAIARSSDIYFYTIGGGNPKTEITGLGPEKLAEWYRKFGLGKILGIDLPGERPGLVPDPAWKERVKHEQWFLGNTYHYAIGQGDLLVTPLQVNSWTATIANGGTIMKPFLLFQVFDASGQVAEEIKPEVLQERVFDQNYLTAAQQGMRQAVTEGSARNLRDLPIAAAGKTGTAQFDANNLNLTHAWFTSYAPFDDPQLAVTVLVEAGGEGSSTAVPVAKKIYQWWAANRMNP